LIFKLKQLAKVNESQQNEPQYSRIIFPTPGKKIDIQFLSLPTDFGEKIFLKLMDRHPIQRLPALSEFYLSLSNMNQIIKVMQSKEGLMLVSGPPKSGKSEFAYSILKELKSENIGILTVEDDIKWHLKDIDQSQVNPKAGFKRSDVLASCLKLHPKVIYIQNIEDPDISELVCRSSESEKVFYVAGIEATDVFEAMSKAIQLGIHKIVSVVINQQRVRRLCDHCKDAYNLSPIEIEQMFVWDQKTEVTAFREKGCLYCKQRGFCGQIGIQEVIIVKDNVRSLLSSRTPKVSIMQAAAQFGYQSKEYDGIKKVLRGLTTFNELSTISSS
jgi:type II secretory ATPase GspE/PulE/Tfp pilus assembly ATPase PilB-like protein